MAFSHDNFADPDCTMSRDSDWFRTNQSRSGTPVTQERASVPTRDYPNAPHRLPPAAPTAFELLVAERAALVRVDVLAAYRPPAGPVHFLLPINPPDTRIAMHGSAPRGERFMAARPRVGRIATNPVPAPSAAPIRFERVAAPSKPHVRAQMSAVADRRVARGHAEAAALAASRLK